jgi:4-carboxymuconolactone decarboxylase
LTTPDRAQLDEADVVFYDRIVATRKKIQGPFTALIHSPDLAARVADVGAFIRFESSLPLACRCLSALVVAREFDCRFEWGGWAPQAEAAGISPEAIESIRLGQDPTDLSEELRLVVDFGRQLLRSPHRVDDETYQAAIARFGEALTVELAASFGYFSMLTFVLNGFEVEPPEDAPLLDGTI